MSAERQRTNVSHDVLNAYYPHNGPLRSYLSTIIPDARIWVSIDNDTDVKQLVDSIVVASQSAWINHPTCSISVPSCSMEEFIKRVQSRIRSESKYEDNVLVFGTKWSWPNTNVTFFSTGLWEALFNIIGEAAMDNLLGVASLFYSVGGDCLAQLTGKSIMYLKTIEVSLGKKRKYLPDLRHQFRPHKRARTYAPPVYQPGIADIKLPRPSIFYAKPRLGPKGRPRLGLPKDHILVSCASEASAKKTLSERDTHMGGKSNQEMALESAARHLAKHVFARQYGMPSVFTSDAYRMGVKHTLRETDIRNLGKTKTPKRVKPSLPLLQRLISLHLKYNYSGSCGLFCKSKLKADLGGKGGGEDITEEDLSNVMEWVSEYPTQAPPSTLDVSHESQVVAHGAAEAEHVQKMKPKFVEYSCGHGQVTAFVLHAVDHVIPRAFWGDTENYTLIRRNVRRLISLRRHESLSLHDVLQGFKTHKCSSWLDGGPQSKGPGPSGSSDVQKRRDLVEDFLYWFFDSFVFSLIKTTFYVTESSAFKNHVLYFRQDDWEILCRPLLNSLMSNTFKKIRMSETDVKEALAQRQLTHSYVRLLPKDTGIRPIVNLRHKAPGALSVNQILQAAFHILNYEKLKAPDLLGASTTSYEELHMQLRDFKARLTGPDPSKPLPKIYFVKMDVRACFDTIDQTKLLEIIRDLLQQDQYIIARRGEIASDAGRLKRGYKASARGEGEWPLFVDHAKSLADRLRNAVFVDQVGYDVKETNEILSLLEEHIADNVVKVGKHYYKQVVGIPQGSILSSVLCAFFYGALERSKLAHLRDKKSLMLRWMDDYLYLTTERSNATTFLGSMNEGHPEYGCFISREKTLTNFHCDEEATVLASNTTSFPWCGLVIDVRTLDVGADFSRYDGLHIADFMTVSTSRHAGSSFEYKMRMMIKQRTQPLFTDPALNSKKVIHLNLFHSLLLTAIKMHQHLKTWGLDVAKHHRFVFGVIKRSLRFCAFQTMTKLTQVRGRPPPASVVGIPVVTWIGLYAFHSTLSRRPTRYKELIADLKTAMRSTHATSRRKALKPMLKQHAHDLDFIAW